jgi:RNA polymerase sigma-70 factor (ECF subfamily)
MSPARAAMNSSNSKYEREVEGLVAKVREGDGEAFMMLTRLFQKKIFIVAYSFFRNKEDALDIVQETFLRCYQKIHLFKNGRSFQNWLIQIAKNLCIDYYRKHHSRDSQYYRAVGVEEMNIPLDSSADPNRGFDIKAVLDKGLKHLTEKQRMIFVMKHYNGLHYEEIAQILNVALGTVKSLHFKAVQNLKTHLTPYMGRIG